MMRIAGDRRITGSPFRNPQVTGNLRGVGSSCNRSTQTKLPSACLFPGRFGHTRFQPGGAAILPVLAFLAALLCFSGAIGSPSVATLRAGLAIVFALASLWTALRLGHELPPQNVLAIALIMVGVPLGVGAFLAGLRVEAGLLPWYGRLNPGVPALLLTGLVCFQVGVSSRSLASSLLLSRGWAANRGLATLGVAGVLAFVSFLGLDLLSTMISARVAWMGGDGVWRSGAFALMHTVLAMTLLIAATPWFIQKRPANPIRPPEWWTWLTVTGVVYGGLLGRIIASA